MTPLSFHAPQVNLYVHNVEASVQFWVEHLGFRETFRTPETGNPEHVEVRLDGLVLGFGSIEAANRVHDLAIDIKSQSAEVVLWTDDVDEAYHQLIAAGAKPITEPHPFVLNLRAAYLAGPNGEHIQIVEDRAPD